MEGLAARAGRGPGPAVSSALLLTSLAVLAAAVLAEESTVEVALVVALVGVVAAARGALLRWHVLVTGVVLVVLFIPIRYQLPGGLPFDLEPYRLVVALVLLAWSTSVLIDARVRLARTPIDKPLLFVAGAVFASVVTNPGRVNETSAHAIKSLMFFASFVLLYFCVTSVMSSRLRVLTLLRTIVWGGFGIALTALVERRTGYNVFNHYADVLPFLHFEGELGDTMRGVRLRVYASSEHPIALGALFVVLVPLAFYFGQITRKRRWWLVQLVLLLGAFATGSRTAIVMMLAVAAVFLWLRPRQTVRLWPLVVPALMVVHIAVPGAIGGLRATFFPEGGLVAEQSRVVEGNELLSDGRVADIRPTLQELSANPLFGIGFGTRIVGFDNKLQNARILDNQWLATLLEIGLVGALAWFWVFWRVIRRLARAAKLDTSPEGWLYVALAGSLGAFAVGMLTFDAFGFIQVTFIFFVLLALASVLARGAPVRSGDGRARVAPGRH
jgi:O-antigen ligase/polysaccharide polymerase Wzy-like membrane protein